MVLYWMILFPINICEEEHWHRTHTDATLKIRTLCAFTLETRPKTEHNAHGIVFVFLEHSRKALFSR